MTSILQINEIACDATVETKVHSWLLVYVESHCAQKQPRPSSVTSCVHQWIIMSFMHQAFCIVTSLCEDT